MNGKLGKGLGTKSRMNQEIYSEQEVAQNFFKHSEHLKNLSEITVKFHEDR